MKLWIVTCQSFSADDVITKATEFIPRCPINKIKATQIILDQPNSIEITKLSRSSMFDPGVDFDLLLHQLVHGAAGRPNLGEAPILPRKLVHICIANGKITIRFFQFNQLLKEIC